MRFAPGPPALGSSSVSMRFTRAASDCFLYSQATFTSTYQSGGLGNDTSACSVSFRPEMSKSNWIFASDLAIAWRARSASSSAAISLGSRTFTMPKPLGSLKTREIPPGFTPCKASRISARSWEGSTSPIRPPSMAVGSTDSSRASTPKSNPPSSRSWILSAAAADLTKMRRKGRVLGDSCPAEACRNRRAAPVTETKIVHRGLTEFMANHGYLIIRHRVRGAGLRF